MVSSVGTTNDSWVLIIIADVKTEASWVDVAMAPQEESTEDWLGEDVEDTVEGGLGVWRDDVSTLRQSPCDGVEEPKEDGPDTADQVCPGDIGAEGGGVLASRPGHGPCDEEERNTSEREVSPLVRRGDQSTDQTSDDHDFINEDGVEDGRPRETSSQKQV